MRVLLADELDGSSRELDRARRRTCLAGQLGCPGAELGEVEPASSAASGTACHNASARSRCAWASAKPKTASAWRAASTEAASASAVRPAAAQWRRELRRRAAALPASSCGEPRVQLLPLAGQDGRVDRLRQQGVAEAEAAGRLLGDEDAVLDGLAQRLAHVALRATPPQRGAAGSRRRFRRPRPGAAGSASPGRAGRPAAAAGRAGHAEARRSGRRRRRGALRRRRGCLRSGRRSRPSAPPAEGRRRGPRATPPARRAGAGRARAPAPSPSAGRARRVGACARPRSARPRGRSPAAGPGRPWRLCARKTTRSSVEVSAQCRSSSTSSRGAAAARSNSSASVSWNTRSCEPAVRPSTRGSAPSEPRASTNGWYGSSVPTRSIERPRRTSNRASRARAASSDASRVLPMPASPVTSAVVPLPAWVASRARSSCPSSRSRPTNTSPVGASIQPVSRRRPWRGRRSYASRDRRIRGRRRRIRVSARCAPAPPRRRSGRSDGHEEANDDSGHTARVARAAADRADEDPRGARRRRPAAARPRVGQRGRAAGPVHPRLVPEPSLLGQAVPERPGRGVPAGGLRPARPRDVAGAPRTRALHRRPAVGRRRGRDHRPAAPGPAGAGRLVLRRLHHLRLPARPRPGPGRRDRLRRRGRQRWARRRSAR